MRTFGRLSTLLRSKSSKSHLPQIVLYLWRTLDAFAESKSFMNIGNENDQADRIISTGKLHALRHFHTQPINVVVFHDPDGEN